MISEYMGLDVDFPQFIILQGPMYEFPLLWCFPGRVI